MNDTEAVAAALNATRSLAAEVIDICTKVPNGTPFIDHSEVLLDQVKALGYAVNHLADVCEKLAKAQEH
jgi:hypothetical protein